MNEQIPEELPPALKELVAAELRRPRPADAHTARLLRRVQMSVLSAAQPMPPVGSKWWLHTLVGVCLGIPAGAALYATFGPQPREPVPQVVIVEQPKVPVAEITVPPAPVPPPEETPPQRVRTSNAQKPEVAASAPAPVRTNDAGTLEAERQMLEGARIALSRGNAVAALEGLYRHQGQFPQGALSEERDALWVQALVNSGQLDTAKQHAAKFRATYPDSFLRPLVDLASPP